MSFNRSPLAFDDLRVTFDQAIASTRGIRVVCRSRAEAVTLRSRFNYLRKQDRHQNMTTYQPDHPLFARSIWDKLVLRIPPKGAKDDMVLYLEKRSHETLVVEEL